MAPPIEFIGMIAHRAQSEIHPPHGPVVDAAYIRRFAQAHEQAGFDRVLVAWGSTSPDALLVASHAAAATSRIGFMVAHRPGFVAPTLAARQFATFDHLSNGRAAIHVISGGSPAEQRKDGDCLSHGERYLRTEEYVSLLKRLWTSDAPFDWEGAYYRFEGGFSEAKPLQKPHIPVYFGGSSDVAIDIAGLKIGWAFAWRTLIAAELVFGASSRSGGLGWFIFERRNNLEIADVVAGLLAVVAIGLLVEGVLFRALEARTVRRWGLQR